MRKIYPLSKILLLSATICLSVYAIAQPAEEEEEEAVQNRPNPMASQKAGAAKSTVKLNTNKTATAKSSAKLTTQRPEGAPQLNSNRPESASQLNMNRPEGAQQLNANRPEGAPEVPVEGVVNE